MEGPGTQEHRARHDALARIHRRRRVTAVGVLVAVATLLALTLNRSAPAGAPVVPTGVVAPPATKPPVPLTGEAARFARDDKAIDDVLGFTSYVSRGSPHSKEVALTFDDGPGPTTAALVRYLVASHVPATFFLVGKAVAERPAIVRAQSKAGFSLGTHTLTHARLGTKSAVEQSSEILGASDRITAITGHAVKLFRPPYGSFDDSTLSILRAERMLMVLWSVDTKDYSARKSKPVIYTALSGRGRSCSCTTARGRGRRRFRRCARSCRRCGARATSSSACRSCCATTRRHATSRSRAAWQAEGRRPTPSR
jgi:peptidoglycan/xylan/chitin deacetylase (PgdA/CDA1 family)